MRQAREHFPARVTTAWHAVTGENALKARPAFPGGMWGKAGRLMRARRFFACLFHGWKMNGRLAVMFIHTGLVLAVCATLPFMSRITA